MKILTKLLLIALITLPGCAERETSSKTEEKVTNPEPSVEFAKLNEYLQKFAESNQIFRFKPGQKIAITGKQGTKVKIDPAYLETENGEPIIHDIEVEVGEFFNARQFITSNIQTVSDDELLVSGGAVYIDAHVDGKKVRLKKGKTYSVELPKTTDNEMSLYYGEQSSSGRMNWKQAGQNFRVKIAKTKSPLFAEIVLTKSISRDTVRKELKTYSKEEKEKLEKEAERYNQYYSPIGLSSFGWINCDRLFIANAPRTTVRYTINNDPQEVNYVKVWLKLKDFNSVAQSQYYSWNNNVDKDDFKNIPIGSVVNFVAVCYQNGKLFAAYSNGIQITKDHTEALTLKEISQSDFKQLLDKIK